MTERRKLYREKSGVHGGGGLILEEAGEKIRCSCLRGPWGVWRVGGNPAWSPDIAASLTPSLLPQATTDPLFQREGERKRGVLARKTAQETSRMGLLLSTQETRKLSWQGSQP